MIALRCTVKARVAVVAAVLHVSYSGGWSVHVLGVSRG